MLRRLPIYLAAALLTVCSPRNAVASDERLEEVTVTSQRRELPVLEMAGNIATIAAELIESVAHRHPHELLSHAAGTWISRGSGQEHLTAIRSPVLTGAGSCGGFLFLEDGIPVRPSGFCNVNQLFEINTEQASRIEVIRGPGNALYGSNALHGIVNVLMPTPDQASMAALEAGSNDLRRFRARLGGYAGVAALVYGEDGGFREKTGYRQGKLHMNHRWETLYADLRIGFSASHLRQETAGFITGIDAYRDDTVRRSNPNPDAFRDADSQRLYAVWSKALQRSQLDLRAWARHSNMQFLQHFLPGKPLEENGHRSAGFIASIAGNWSRHRWTAGVDLEWSDTFLRQTQFSPTQGSDFLRETRPQGKHYDYEVRSVAAAPWVQFELQANDRLTAHAGLRAESVRYAYRNRMLTGNTRDDGSACGFGGCLYSRPADRSDTFDNLAPKLGFTLKLAPRIVLFGNAARGFRAPQMSELYRLQSGQSVADLTSERLDSAELGLRASMATLSTEVALFAMRKRGSVLRDSDGFNVSNGRSRHSGIEWSAAWHAHRRVSVNTAISYARHRYDFDLIAARGETFSAGNDVDTAPRWTANVDIRYDLHASAQLALQWALLDEYFLDAENKHRYPGHNLFNLRGHIEFSPRWSVHARVNNLLDRAIADRADFAFGNYRYFPGRGREYFLELRYTQ